ncbi:hypothetical protein B0H12DRAFT_468519 [Mycena haematopus]|nr:hypothetical protein B0H12DRAFT_468519 [Mycena haematopus]
MEHARTRNPLPGLISCKTVLDALPNNVKHIQITLWRDTQPLLHFSAALFRRSMSVSYLHGLALDITYDASGDMNWVDPSAVSSPCSSSKRTCKSLRQHRAFPRLRGTRLDRDPRRGVLLLGAAAVQEHAEHDVPEHDLSIQWFWEFSLAFIQTGSAYFGALKFWATYFALRGLLESWRRWMERGRPWPLIFFVFAWSTLVCNPIACWTWNSNGWCIPPLPLCLASSFPMSFLRLRLSAARPLCGTTNEGG